MTAIGIQPNRINSLGKFISATGFSPELIDLIVDVIDKTGDILLSTSSMCNLHTAKCLFYQEFL